MNRYYFDSRTIKGADDPTLWIRFNDAYLPYHAIGGAFSVNIDPTTPLSRNNPSVFEVIAREVGIGHIRQRHYNDKGGIIGILIDRYCGHNRLDYFHVIAAILKAAGNNLEGALRHLENLNLHDVTYSKLKDLRESDTEAIVVVEGGRRMGFYDYKNEIVDVWIKGGTNQLRTYNDGEPANFYFPDLFPLLLSDTKWMNNYHETNTLEATKKSVRQLAACYRRDNRKWSYTMVGIERQEYKNAADLLDRLADGETIHLWNGTHFRIDEDGRLIINGVIVTIDKLKEEMKRHLEHEINTKIGDRNKLEEEIRDLAAEYERR
tara:strand:- start:47 stop:1006 length:960 start_codon:yes stop_codon:yes gene_type:complete